MYSARVEPWPQSQRRVWTFGRKARANARRPCISAVVASEPDAIVVWSPQLALAAKQATNRIPIVFIVVFDPVDFGVVPNLYRPGGNVTGISKSA